MSNEKGKDFMLLIPVTVANHGRGFWKHALLRGQDEFDAFLIKHSKSVCPYIFFIYFIHFLNFIHDSCPKLKMIYQLVHMYVCTL